MLSMKSQQKGWNVVNDEDVFVLTPDDYTAMGEPGKNFKF